MKKKWIVTVEKSNGSWIRKRTEAANLDEASENVRGKIPTSWRIVAVEEVYQR